MNYEEAMQFIASTGKFGQRLGLENITRLTNYLGNPERDLKFVHVAGTNGKGSTCAMIASVLSAAGYKTGLYISPFLENFNERIQLDNVPISDEALADAATIVKAACDAMVRDGCNHPTEFEINTAMAFVFYKKASADIVVLEVGLGGRLDATNVIPGAEAAVITSISYDHQQYLGDTLEKIAFEKASIIKTGYHVCIYALNPPEIKKIITDFAAEKHAFVHIPDKSDIRLISSDIDVQHLSYEKKDSKLNVREFELGLIGSHQVYNALNALAALEILKSRGWNIGPEAVKTGMARVQFKGRFEILNKTPLIVIDGGHNIEGITSFVENFSLYFPGKKANLFFGMLSDKQVDASVALLSKIAKCIYTLTPEDPRAVCAADMTRYIKTHYKNIESVPLADFGDIEKYIDFDRNEEIYAFTGSLYMIGHARTKLNTLIRRNAAVHDSQTVRDTACKTSDQSYNRVMSLKNK